MSGWSTRLLAEYEYIGETARPLYVMIEEYLKNAQEDDVVDEGFIPVKASVNGEDVKEKAVKNELLDSGNK
nr:unnamed protein product [Haemonchus contortus]